MDILDMDTGKVSRMSYDGMEEEEKKQILQVIMVE
jgi:hypothetical protein